MTVLLSVRFVVRSSLLALILVLFLLTKQEPKNKGHVAKVAIKPPSAAFATEGADDTSKANRPTTTSHGPPDMYENVHSKTSEIHQHGSSKPRDSVKWTPSKNYPKSNTESTLYNHTTCFTQGAPDFATDWKRRAPYFVLLGTMKGGTEALMTYLRQHPQIANPLNKEAGILDRNFDKYETANGILRREGRNMYANFMRLDSIRHCDIMDEPSMIASDNTPRYLLWSNLVPARLFCVAPWVKLLVLLRDPEERSFSHYTMTLNSRTRKKQSTSAFENWIKKDLQRMKEYGLIPPLQKWTDQEDYDLYAGSEQERRAWYSYTGERDRHLYHGAIVGRSLYSIQLRQWFEAMDRINKPRSDLLILRSEELRTDTQGVVGRVLDFLGLPPFSIKDLNEKHQGRYKSTLTNETRQMLQEFFEPYNRELYGMLGSEWNGVWDP